MLSEIPPATANSSMPHLPLRSWLAVFAVILTTVTAHGAHAARQEITVGATAVDLAADDSMVIGGSIGPGKVQGQEGRLRAVAVVVKHEKQSLAIVSCDVLMLTRDLLDPVAAEVQKTCGIPPDRLLVQATHTHHAPSTVTVHGYRRDEKFCLAVQQAIVRAVREAWQKMSDGCRFEFALGREATVGQNSRLLLSDGTIFWGGPRTDAVRPTGPFDPDLPLLVFRHSDGKLAAMLFNHSTHTIGTVRPRVRSPSFYGLAAQEIEAKLGGVVKFLEGASGSTHNLALTAAEAQQRIEQAVLDTLEKVQPMPVAPLDGRKKPFRFRVRKFDEAQEDVAVSAYCEKRVPAQAKKIVEVFRRQREVLAPQQGELRETWIQVLRIGDVAIVGVPAELFTQLGLDIKRRSPLRHTIVAELANDWIGYLPDREAHRLGGYQTWTGLHSYAEVGTGERMVDATVELLGDIAGRSPAETSHAMP